MIAVLTKWQKNAPTSIPWPDTLDFINLYSETNLPPDFTLVEYGAFITYVRNLSMATVGFGLLVNNNVHDADGNIINSRIFMSDEEFNIYKALSDSNESERNTLLAMFNLTRTVKIINDENTVIDAITKSSSYDDINALFTA